MVRPGGVRGIIVMAREFRTPNADHPDHRSDARIRQDREPVRVQVTMLADEGEVTLNRVDTFVDELADRQDNAPPGLATPFEWYKPDPEDRDTWVLVAKQQIVVRRGGRSD